MAAGANVVQERELVYRGSPPLASLLVTMLEAEGVDVEWEPPLEQRDLLQTVGEAAAIALVVRGSEAAIKAAIRKFRRRNPQAEIEWREQDGYR